MSHPPRGCARGSERDATMTLTPQPPPTADPIRAKAAMLFAGGARIQAVAVQCAVDRRTVGRWRREPGFQRMVRAGRTRLTERALGLLERAAVKAVGVLVTLAEKAEGADVARIRACDAILSHAVRYREQVELVARVAELEAKINGAA
jgi:hypothetical protein